MTLPIDKQDVCGYGQFSLPPDHPFTAACKAHDDVFMQKHANEPTIGRSAADAFLLRNMLDIAKAHGSVKLRLQAYAYYTLARIFGGLFWYRY